MDNACENDNLDLFVVNCALTNIFVTCMKKLIY